MKDIRKIWMLFIAVVIGDVASAQMPSPGTTFVANGNPIIRYKYSADPAAFVEDGMLYLYAGHDVCPPPHNYYHIDEWNVYVTDDMKTWKEYPVPLKANDFKWAKGEAWASQVIKRNGKYYWYVTVEHATKKGKSIGVAVSDSPIGLFVDARGSAFITNDMTAQYTPIALDDIDPTVFIDDDGQAYLIRGNTQCYYAKLKENMIELDSEIMTISLPRVLERLDYDRQKLIIVYNKKDLAQPNDSIQYEWECEVLYISARDGDGIKLLQEALLRTIDTGIVEADETIVTNMRHYEALLNSQNSLCRVREGLECNLSGELVAMDIHEALDELGSITGEVSSQDVLNNIFKNFCIGK